ncbi:MAG: hypothetical protein P9X24_04610 [Candidatus Hatepunaea meridiana]|nr:hypothetical protein [Candidatus Hatepunaea meridiana]
MAITVDPSTRGIRVYTLSLTSAVGGAVSTTLDLYGEIMGIWLDIGTLSSPDIDISDTTSGELCLTVDAVGSDTMWHPKILCTNNAAGALTATGNTLQNYYIGNCTVAITGAGDNNTGEIYIYVKNS